MTQFCRHSLLAFLLFSLAACDFSTPAEKRAQQAAEAQGSIVVGVVQSSAQSNLFLQGVALAVEKINQGGGVLGRRLETAVYDDLNSPEQAEQIARKLAEDNEVVAVVGHGDSKAAVPASVIYEQEGIVFLACSAKIPALTLYSNSYTFRTVPSAKEFGSRMSEFLKKYFEQQQNTPAVAAPNPPADYNAVKRYFDQQKSSPRAKRRIVVFVEREEEQESLAEFFKASAADLSTNLQRRLEDAQNTILALLKQREAKAADAAALNENLNAAWNRELALEKEVVLEIVAERSYFAAQTDFRALIDQLNKEYSSEVPQTDFAAAVICGSTMPAAAELVLQLKEMGFRGTILGGDGLDSPQLLALAGEANEGVIMPAIFNPDAPDGMTAEFSKKFAEKYAVVPDAAAAQGYDAIALLAYAISKSGSAVPDEFASRLRFLKQWHGVAGSCAFAPTGDSIGKEMHFKQLRNGRFVFLQKQPAQQKTLP